MRCEKCDLNVPDAPYCTNCGGPTRPAKRDYLVRLEVVLSARSPGGAAREAKLYLSDPANIGSKFDVLDWPSGYPHGTVDLDSEELNAGKREPK